LRGLLDRLQCPVDNTHAGSCAGSTLVLDGDSITANTGENSNVIIADRYGDQGLASMQGVPFYRYFDVAVGGHTCQHRGAAYTTDVHPKINIPGSKYNVASIQCGINDYNTGTTVAATVYARI